MNKTLVLLAFISAISVNSYALEITKGKILQHKEWTDGKITATYLHSSKNLLQLKHPNALKQSSNDQGSQYSYTQIMSHIGPKEGKTGLQANVEGSHDINFYNQTKNNKTYYYLLSTCIETAPKKTICAYYSDLVELEPEGSLYDTLQTQLKYVFEKTGTYKSTSGTYLTSNTYTTNDILSSFSESTVTITEK